jgi:4-amino-4-deoxy-L-arabinose transferase-like glycosyltransferase
VIAGTLVTVPVYLVALTLYGPVVARIAAFLLALHPLLIGYSAAVYVEPTYLLFLMLGLYYALRAQALDSYVPSAVAGLAFALAYLARVEAFILPLATVPLLFIPNWRTPRRAAIACGVLLASFLVVASPYIVFLWTQTGSIRLEAKSPVFFLVLRRMTSGLSYLEAAYGLDGDLREGGPFLQPWLSIVQSTTYSVSDVLGYLATTGRPRLIGIFTALTGRQTGSWLLLLLVVLGLLRSPWDRARIVREALLLTLLASVIGSLLMTQWLPTRYLVPPLAFLLVWAAKGVQELGDWVRATLRSVLPTARSATLIGRSAQALLMVMLPVVALTGVRWESELLQGLVSERTTKEAGLWLRDTAPGAKTIMDVSSVFAFYAGGTHLYLPYCEAGTALRYFAKKNPDFIVLSSHTSALRPYLPAWIETGIPDSRATLVYSRPWSDGGKIIVYRWHS